MPSDLASLSPSIFDDPLPLKEDKSAVKLLLALSVSVSVVPDKDIDELVVLVSVSIEDKSAVTLLLSVSVNVSMLPDKDIDELVVLVSTPESEETLAHDNPPFPLVVNT